jgi:hypothetical protein
MAHVLWYSIAVTKDPDIPYIRWLCLSNST